MPVSDAIVAEGPSKRYNAVDAVAGISFNVRRGALFGFLGPTFEKNRSFERLLLAPIPLELLMLAKTGGAILFGVAIAFDLAILCAYCVGLFLMSLFNIRRRWIA